MNKAAGPSAGAPSSPVVTGDKQQQNQNANDTRQRPNLPRRYLLSGPRAKYLEIGVPLYEAAIKCDWDAAKAIFDKKPELVRYSITENGETALHVAASAKLPQGEVFVKNLVGLMTEEDLALENEYFNTALYLAAAAGNLKSVNIMVEKNRDLVTIPGARRQMLPLYAAVLFGYHYVAEYLYGMSSDLCDAHGWNDKNRGWLLEKCVENDMLDIALTIMKKYPKLGGGNALALLARKPKAFHEIQSTIKGRVAKMVYAFGGSKMKIPANESRALQLLKIIWKNIAKEPKIEIDRILRGPPDMNKKDNSAPRRAVQVMKLQELVSDHINTVSDIIRQEPYSSQLKSLISKCLVRMHDETQNIIKGASFPISGKADQALELQKLISENIVYVHDEVQKINEITVTVKENHEAIQLNRLQRVISDHIEKMKKESYKISRRPERQTYSSRVIFIAAEIGNTEFLVELIRQYPDLIWKVNENNQTIFHIAVKYRHADIYNLLYEIGAMKDMITPLRDPNENNMLHLVGICAGYKQLEDISVVFQMQRELLWFEEVKEMIPPSYREQKNSDGLTPHELFKIEHRDLVSKGEKWMKEVGAQSIVVAALVATMVFTAAFTVPGGYGQTDGIPVFHSKLSFQIFVVADAISLLFSTTSMLFVFLSIFTSRYGERDFLVSAPKKLIIGLLYLYLSIASMLIAFCTGFFILYQKGLLWMPILISLFALIPFFLYAKEQLHLLPRFIFTTFTYRNLFNPKKRVLYYENPKV